MFVGSRNIDLILAFAILILVSALTYLMLSLHPRQKVSLPTAKVENLVSER